jgi:asparagine synthase (glutamine-hydrolysing)
MCGFVGWIDLAGEARGDREALERMTARLIHRGPDNDGFFEAPGVSLGFRRLSIIDLCTGDQPIFNEDRSLVVLCNGEIFNYRELRAELEQRGHTFQTGSDVEVLVHLYEEHGADLVGRLNGQFAFALWDTRRRRLLLARDHFGINPLFYGVFDGRLFFGSEIKAILEHPAVPRDVDLTGLDQVLTFPGLVSPRTLFKGISSLKSGHFLLAENGAVRTVEYWDLDYPLLEDALPEKSEAAWADELGEAFAKSVRYRLQADVPVGFYLSGGLDSSLIAAQIHALEPAASRHSFSISFNERHMSEDRFQKLMAERVGSRHHEIVFDWAEICQSWERMLYHCECPVKETYNTCSLALSASARSHGVPVILTGEGADELFAGYVGYRFDQSSLRDGARLGLEEALEEELREKAWGDPALFYETDFYSLQETKTTLYAPAVAELYDQFDCLNFGVVDTERLRGRHPIHQRSYLDFKLRLADHLLSDHGDRMALANSVEARYPFLDIGLVDLATRMPPELKLNGLREKYILKKMAERMLPREILDREKFGFHAPGSSHLLRTNREWVEDFLSYDRIRRQGYFDPDVVERLKQEYSRDGFLLNLPFESDLLMVVLSFSVFLEVFDLPALN